MVAIGGLHEQITLYKYCSGGFVLGALVQSEEGCKDANEGATAAEQVGRATMLELSLG